MDDLTIGRAMNLARAHGGNRISLFMPTKTFVPGSPDENATRLKNLLREAETRLGERGVRSAEVERLLGPAYDLTDNVPFWMRADEGLAVLLGPEGMHAIRVPSPLPEMVRVNSRYHLRPLLPHIETGGEYWLLFISQKSVRLYRGTREGLTEVSTEGIPTSLREALRWDDFEQAQLQFHGHTARPGGGRAVRPFYHGNKNPDIKNELARYFRQIDQALSERLRDSAAPLVIAGVDYLIPIYRDVNTYPNLVHEAVTGNAEILPLPELHRLALGAMQRLARDESRQLAHLVAESWGSARTTPDPETIVPAAFTGRVGTLVVSGGEPWWGRYDPETGKAIVHRTPAEGDDDLLDLAALQTLENGGAVVNLPAEDMPHGETAVALLRY